MDERRCSLKVLHSPQAAKSFANHVENIWGFPKIRGTILGGPYNKDYSIWGSILGPLILGNYHLGTGMWELFRA